MAYDYNDDTTEAKSSAKVGLMAVIIVVLVALVGWFYYDAHTPNPTSVTNSVTGVLKSGEEKAKDVGKDTKQLGEEALDKVKPEKKE